MIEQSISKRYARALLSLALEQGKDKIDAFRTQLETFEQASLVSPALLETLGNRYFDIAARDRIVDQVADKIGFATEVRNFIKLLMHKGRIELFHTVLEEYQNLANQHMGREVMTVVSAVDLPDDQYQSLQEIFGKVTGKTMVLKRKKQPDVLGGVRVHIKDKVYDYTIKNQLEQMKHKLLA